MNRSVPEGRAVAGNPARPYTTYAEILERVGSEARDENIFDFGDIETGSLTAKVIKERIDRDGIAFVKTVPSNDPFYVNTDMEEMRKNAMTAYLRFKDLMQNMRQDKENKKM